MDDSFYKLADCRENLELIKEIGKGASGKVYLAKYVGDRTDRADRADRTGPVAVKVFNFSDELRGEKDTSITNELFDGLVGSYLYSKKCKVTRVREVFHCAESETNEFMIVMDYIEGTSLKEYAQEKLPPSIKFDITRKLLKAFTCLHDHNVYHRDIKLDNIMIEHKKGDEVKIIDFGLSCVEFSEDFSKFVYSQVDEGLGDLIMEQTCTLESIGAPLYRPPEEFLEQVDKGTFGDVWFLQLKDSFALGCLLYELWALDGDFMTKDVGNTIEKVKDYIETLLIEGKNYPRIPVNAAPADLIDMVASMTEFQSDRRMTIGEALTKFEKDRNSNLSFILQRR